MNIWTQSIWKEKKPVVKEKKHELVSRYELKNKKQCTKCFEVKNETDFYNRGTGLKDSFCKECRKKMNLARYWKKR